MLTEERARTLTNRALNAIIEMADRAAHDLGPADTTHDLVESFNALLKHGMTEDWGRLVASVYNQAEYACHTEACSLCGYLDTKDVAPDDVIRVRVHETLAELFDALPASSSPRG